MNNVLATMCYVDDGQNFLLDQPFVESLACLSQ